MKRLIMALTLSGVVTTSVLAESWTLQECLDYAAQHNIQVQKNRISVEEAKQSLLQSQAALFPSLSFYESYYQRKYESYRFL